MRIYILYSILAVILAGCGSLPKYISCKGEGSVTATGNVMAYAGTSSLVAKCGDGFTYSTREPKP